MQASLLDSENPPFDRVEVVVEGTPTTYAYAEFMALQLAVRIRLILAGQPRFLLGEALVDKKSALCLA